MANETTKSVKSCFVIAPIGEEGSSERNRSDKIFKYVISPATSKFDYVAERSDHIAKPGIITGQVINRVVADDLVVADLTTMNPNVFYELAIRHAVKKPIIQLIEKGEKIPFDVAASRTIIVDHKDLDSVEAAKTSMMNQIAQLELNPRDFETPISVAIDLQLLPQSQDPQMKTATDVLTELLSNIKVELGRIGSGGTDKLAMANLADAIQGLVTHMRTEQQMIREWADGQSVQNSQIKQLLQILVTHFDDGKLQSRKK